MKKHNLNTLIIIFTFNSILILLLSGCSMKFDLSNSTSSILGILGMTAQKIEETKIEVSEKYQLNIKNTNGSIEVNAYDGKDVRIKAIKNIDGFEKEERLLQLLDDIKLDLNDGTGNIYIDIEYPEEEGRITKREVSLIIMVPQGLTGIRVETKSSGIVLYGLNDLTISEIKTSSGNVSVRNFKGEQLKCTTTSGEITINGFEGILSCDTSAGYTKLEKVRLYGGTEFYSTSGNIIADMESLDTSGEYSFMSSSGDISLYIDEGNDFSLNAASHSGKINSNFPLEGEAVDEDETEIKGDVENGLIINIKSDSGKINILKKQQS